jgi:putative flippase GtrA
MTGRALRFAAAGAGGFVVQVAALAALTRAGMHYVPATALAVEAAIITNFLWHERWTWRDRVPATGGLLSRLLQFNALTALTSIVAGVFLTAFFVEAIAVGPVGANILAVAVMSVVNFIGADRVVFRSVAAAIVLGLAAPAHAGEAKLQPRTLASFQRYAAAVEARRVRELAGHQLFLELDRHSAADRARILGLLQRGDVFVERAPAPRDEAQAEMGIVDGTINHWRGTVLIPGVTLDRVLDVLQSPDTATHKQEDLLWSRVVPRGDGRQTLTARVKRTKFVTVVYDTEYDVRYERLAPTRALSNSISTRIVEIENAGTPRERALPEGDAHGYMWRLNSYWRYQQVDGGVLIEVESLTLSRDLPPILGTLIMPIVNSTARESVTRTLASMRGRFGS